MIIGLDGATWSLLDRFCAEGVLPNLTRVRAEGASGPLWSVVPPMTATAWTSFQTGKGPGRHGIFDWTEPVPGTYLYRPIDSTRMQARTLFETLSERGRRVASVNLPLTFPARPVNGVMVGDMLTPSKEADGFLFPKDFKGTLDRVVPDYQIDTHLCGAEDDLRPFLARLRQLIEGRGALVRHLLQQEPWDVFCTVWVEMDRMQHCLWHVFDERHPRHDRRLAAAHRDAILDIYRLIDTRVGEMMDLRPEGANVFFLSDHGFGPCRYKVFLNKWLAREGFLSFKEGGTQTRDRLNKVRGLLDRAGIDTRRLLSIARGVGGGRVLAAGDSLSRFAAEIDWEHTQAYCHGTNAIRLNLKGRERQGAVDPADAARVIAQLKTKLEDLRDPEGNRCIRRVATREELYEGPEVELAADVLIAEHDDSVWFYYSEGENPEQVFEPSGWASGNHEPDGIFAAWGPDVAPGRVEGANVVDVLPTVFAAMDEPIPDDIDGRVLHEVFRPERRVAPRWVEAAAYHAVAGDRDAATDRSIEERLRGLGYLQ